MSWMAWTWQTAAFFSAIGLALAAMTWAEIRWPTKVRQGFLPIAHPPAATASSSACWAAPPSM